MVFMKKSKVSNIHEAMLCQSPKETMNDNNNYNSPQK